MNGKLGAVDQQLLKTANRKQQNRENFLWFVENCDIKLEILHKHNPFERITGHVIITTIISKQSYHKHFFCEVITTL